MKQKEEIKTHNPILEQHSSLSSTFSSTSSKYSKSLSPEFTGTGLKCFQILKKKNHLNEVECYFKIKTLCDFGLLLPVSRVKDRL